MMWYCKHCEYALGNNDNRKVYMESEIWNKHAAALAHITHRFMASINE